MARSKGKQLLILELRVRGTSVRRGRIPLPELIKICEEAQNAVIRQAEALEGKKTVHPGPANAAIRERCTLELVGLKAGSTRLQFGVTKPQMPLPESATLAEDAIRELREVFHSLENSHQKQIDPGVLQAVYKFSGVIGSQGVNSIDWISIERNGRRKRHKATVDGATKECAAARLSAPRTATVHVDGVLDMADFKPGDKKCRIDPAIGVPIPCTFDPEKENVVYKLLRSPVRIIGKAVFRPYTDQIDSIHIDEIRPLHSLEVGKDTFFANLSIEELARYQNISTLQDVRSLSGGIPEDEDVDAFLQDIYESRKS